MNTGKNRVKGLKTELFKKKYQTGPMVTNPTDMLGIPDITKDISQSLPSKGSRFDWSTGTEPNVKLPEYNPVTIDTKAEKAGEEKINIVGAETEPYKRDWRDYVRMGVGTTAAIKGIYDDIQTRQDNTERIQNLNDRPRYMPNEYEYMARPGSQGVIYAKHGAEIRTGTNSGAEEAELERGEMFMMPNMDTYIVGGKKHSQGGENFVLPEGTIVFSDHLKVPGLKKTFSDEAKKYDISKYKKILDNPHAKAVDRSTAEVLFDRNMKKLQELFQIQQQMNGNSTGEMEPEAIRKGQKGLFNVTQPVTFGPNAPLALTPEQRKEYYQNQGMFHNPNYTEQAVTKRDFSAPYSSWNEENLSTKADEAQAETKRQKDFLDNLKDTVDNAVANSRIDADTGIRMLGNMEDNYSFYNAAQNQPNNPATLGATPTPTLNTATEQNKQVLSDETGTQSKTNAADSSSVYYKTLPNGKKIFIENQGEFAGKRLAEQYGNDPTNLLRNRLNEFGDELNPLLTDAFNNTVKNEGLKISSADELVNILEGGNSDLTAIRNFYKGMGQEAELFDFQLDKGYDPDIQRQKAAEKYKAYIESSQFVEDVKAGRTSPDSLPFLKNKPVAYKDANGQTRYKIDNPELNLDAVQKYQAAYKAIASVKQAEKKRGKDKDRLRGFKVAPEGLADQMFLGMPISDDDRRHGNTTMGQLLGFEDEPLKPKEKPGEEPKRKDPGNGYNKKLEGATMGKYNPEGFDYPQLAPEIYGVAASQMFAYAPMDYNAPYLMPQTLNIQPQLQDIDNSYVAAMNAGADPNTALIATLGAKQRVFSEKQNFDAQQRAAADQYNAQSRFQEDVYDMQSLDRVYNTLIAQADDAVTAQRQALVASASQKRSVWKQEEARKQFWYNNFVRSFDYDPKTRSLTVKKDADKEFAAQLEGMYSNTAAIPEVDKAKKTTSTTTK